MTTGYYFHIKFIYAAVLLCLHFNVIAGFSLLVGKYIYIGCIVHTY